MKSTQKIAMKVTEEEFNDILTVLKENGLVDNYVNEWDESHCWLVNIRNREYRGVNLYTLTFNTEYKILPYNKELFLQYCGIEPKKEIMKTNFMSLDGKTKEVKETVFTSFIGVDFNAVQTILKPSEFKNVLHIGFDNHYGDVFKCWCEDINAFLIFFGTAGDEFKK